jgi:hypothetical protein
MTGVYSATFALSQYNTTVVSGSDRIYDFVRKSGSIVFEEIWGSADKSIGYYTGSLAVITSSRSAYVRNTNRLFVNITNLQDVYKPDELIRLRVFVEDIDRSIVAKKLPIETKSEIFEKMYYQVRDAETSDVLVPFETDSNGTCLSYDTDGMFFDFYIDSLIKGRTYKFEFLIKDRGIDELFSDVAATFRVDA